MKNPLKRWDVFLNLATFVLMIPSEGYEIFSIGKKPEKRYQTGTKMAEHLRVCLERLNDHEQNVSQA